MENNFKYIVREIFKKHGLEDDKLESVVGDLFVSFENHLLENTAEKIAHKVNEVNAINDMTRLF